MTQLYPEVTVAPCPERLFRGRYAAPGAVRRATAPPCVPAVEPLLGRPAALGRGALIRK